LQNKRKQARETNFIVMCSLIGKRLLLAFSFQRLEQKKKTCASQNEREIFATLARVGSILALRFSKTVLLRFFVAVHENGADDEHGAGGELRRHHEVEEVDGGHARDDDGQRSREPFQNVVRVFDDHRGHQTAQRLQRDQEPEIYTQISFLIK